MTEPRNYLEEAVRIARGESMLLPQIEHLRALNESRVYWRTVALGHQIQPPQTLTPQPERRPS